MRGEGAARTDVRNDGVIAAALLKFGKRWRWTVSGHAVGLYI